MDAKTLKTHYYKGKANAYAWPGGYPLFFVMTDGGCICPKCATKERAQIFRSTHEQSRDGWGVAGVDINYEDAYLFCDHCGERIESAYAESEENYNDPTD